MRILFGQGKAKKAKLCKSGYKVVSEVESTSDKAGLKKQGRVRSQSNTNFPVKNQLEFIAIKPYRADDTASSFLF